MTTTEAHGVGELLSAAELDKIAALLRKFDRRGGLGLDVHPVIVQAADAIEVMARRSVDALDLLKGMVGLVQIITGRDDMPAEIKAVTLDNHRYVDALAYITLASPAPSRVPAEPDQGSMHELVREDGDGEGGYNFAEPEDLERIEDEVKEMLTSSPPLSATPAASSAPTPVNLEAACAEYCRSHTLFRDRSWGESNPDFQAQIRKRVRRILDAAVLVAPAPASEPSRAQSEVVAFIERCGAYRQRLAGSPANRGSKWPGSSFLCSAITPSISPVSWRKGWN